MAKTKSVFFCTQCGYESSGWLGKCPGCGGMMVEKGQNLVCVNDGCKKIIPRPEETE